MRNDLPKSGSKKNESGIVNLDDKDESGTHSVASKNEIIFTLIVSGGVTYSHLLD